ncbi:MAG TPA: NAD(P)H-hydrate dehydratase [Bacteroidales bacterium]|nr:NAD(P)H-hydrate dehydratase [Bacteroidales bacterium]
MKILNNGQIREADQYTIEHEPIASIDLMERAAKACTDWIREMFPEWTGFHIFCGPGNNGGDGLVIARLLAGAGYPVDVVVVWFQSKGSPDFLKNLERAKEMEDIRISEIHSGDQELPRTPREGVVIDALFGSGLSRPVTGLAAKVIRHINTCGCPVIAIDMPSGLFADKVSIPAEGEIVKAGVTLCFELPKLALLFPENEKYVGEWVIIPIGLHETYIRQTKTRHYMLEADAMSELAKPRSRFSHKGNFGHALLIAGNQGKMGAAVLCAEACLRSGAGLVTVSVPEDCWQILQPAVPEAMVSIRPGSYQFVDLKVMPNFHAIAVGPGLGTAETTATALKLLIQSTTRPLILDADALNILAENKTWLGFLPAHSILTPHPKEFERLAGSTADSWERLELQRDFSIKNNVFVILKGAHTCITTPAGDAYFNGTGNPGMATAGCGDALTGVLAGLIAQGYTPLESALLGTWVHGLAGDLALEDTSYEGLITRDLIQKLGEAFRLTSP